jgi:hypothetical protein
MTGPRIREMEEGDRDAVAALAEQAFGGYYPMDWAANAGALLAASRAGRVVTDEALHPNR